MAAADNPQIARAAILVEHYNADEQFRYELEARERFLHDQASRQLTARLDGFDQGHAEGRAEGHAEGVVEGAAAAVRSAALNALRLGLSEEQVCAVTGLDHAEIARLAQVLDT